MAEDKKMGMRRWTTEKILLAWKMIELSKSLEQIIFFIFFFKVPKYSIVYRYTLYQTSKFPTPKWKQDQGYKVPSGRDFSTSPKWK